MKKIWVLQNASPENLGIVGQILQNYGLEPTYVRTFAGEAVPRYMEGAVGLVVLGGPMGVYEQNRYSFINDIIRLIDQAMKEAKPVLGICLGSQILATALGASITRGPQKEIGWHPIELTPAAGGDRLMHEMESSFMGYHWHGDIFQLPRGAVALASSALTACQAFAYESTAYGILFHMEVSEKIIGDMIEAFDDELREENIDGGQIKAAMAQHLHDLNNNGRLCYQSWATLCLEAATE